MAKKKKPEPPENHERWLVSYADFMTLLFALFVVLYSFAMAKQSETRALVQGLIESLGQIGLISRPVGSPILEGGTGILEPKEKVIIDNPEATATISDPHPNSDGNSQQVHENYTPASQPINLNIGISEEGKEKEDWPYKTAEELKNKLREQIENHEIEIEQFGQQVLIRLGDKPLFPSNSANLQPQFLPLLAEIAQVLADTPGEITVVGHTDDSTANDELYPSNWELSVLRASIVVRALLRNTMLVPSRIAAQGVADSRPRFPNNSIKNRQKNRRVEILLEQGKPTEKDLPLLNQGEKKPAH